MGASQPVQVFQTFKPSQTSNPSLENLKGTLTFKPSQALNVNFNFTSRFQTPRIQSPDENQNSYGSEISLIRRPVRHILNHSALFVVSICEQNGQSVKKFHIVEYMNDSRVHMQQIKRFEQNESYYKIDQADWKIEEFCHDVELKKYNVNQIREMMKQQAYQKGQYDLLHNNCNKVANEFFQNLKNKNQ